MSTDVPPWLALLAPLPDDITPTRTPVVGSDAASHPDARAIAGWHQLLVDLPAGEHGRRHALVVLDARDGILSANDGVLRTTRRPGASGTMLVEYVHENIGGRFADDGSFHGTCWRIVNEGVEGEDDVEQLDSSSRAPTSEEIDRVRALVATIVRRAPPRGG